MFLTYEQLGLPRHTSLSLACEQFIKGHGVQGIVYTEATGGFPELEYADMSSAFLSEYWMHPDGPAIFSRNCESLGWAIYFARCTVDIHQELALGPFPKRLSKDWKRKVVYPALPGTHNDIYLWNFQVEDARRAGCTVQVHEGWSWNEVTTDNLPWSQEAYWLRQHAPTKDIEEKTKACVVAAIGFMGRDRYHYSLIEDGGNLPTDRCAVNEYREPVDLWIREEYDPNTALMSHWWYFTVCKTASDVYNFALPYAVQGKLVSIDHDSILVLEVIKGKDVVRKHTPEAVSCPAGTWKWMLLHNVEVLGDRRFKSDELTHMPGVSKDPQKQMSTAMELAYV